MVAAADATADSTMHREYVVDTNISNYRVMKVLPDTGSTSSNSVEDEIAGWIESVERKLSSNCYLPSNMHHQPTTVSMTWNGAHTVVRNKNEMFNLLLFNELKQTTELLPCLIARTIPTSIDLMIGLPTIRKQDEEPPPSKWPILDPWSWTRKLREVKDVIRVPVDNYQLATLATIKHRSDIIESVDDNDEIEWTENPYECKSQPATEGSPLIDLLQIQGPPSLRRKLRALCEEYSDIFDTAVRAE